MRSLRDKIKSNDNSTIKSNSKNNSNSNSRNNSNGKARFMAIFHHSTQIIGRSAGRSSIAAAAYRLGVKMVDERTGLTHNYAKKKGVDSWMVMAPHGAPAWAYEPELLWNEVEKTERRGDAQLCREVNIALPRELTTEQMKALANEYIEKNWVSRGMVAMVAYHDLNSDNPHCHIMLTMRDIKADGFGNKNRSWNDKALATEYRKVWAEMANSTLEQYGHASRIDHRSLEDQGIEREPTQHQGQASCAMEKRGLKVDRTRIVAEVHEGMSHQQALADLKREQKQEVAVIEKTEQEYIDEMLELKAVVDETQKWLDEKYNVFKPQAFVYIKEEQDKIADLNKAKNALDDKIREASFWKNTNEQNIRDCQLHLDNLKGSLWHSVFRGKKNALKEKMNQHEEAVRQYKNDIKVAQEEQIELKKGIDEATVREQNFIGGLKKMEAVWDIKTREAKTAKATLKSEFGITLYDTMVEERQQQHHSPLRWEQGQTQSEQLKIEQVPVKKKTRDRGLSR